MKLPDAAVSPFVDDLYLIEPDAASSASLTIAPNSSHSSSSSSGPGDAAARLKDTEDLLLKSRSTLVAQFLASIRKRSASSSTTTKSRSATAETASSSSSSSPPPPPPNAFLTAATITLQLSMLRHLSLSSSDNNNSALALAACDGLLHMLEPMPIRSLRELSSWEQGAMMQISAMMEDLAAQQTSPQLLGDAVKSLLLSFAIHRASLASILQVLETILLPAGSNNEAFACAPQTQSLILRMTSLPVAFPLSITWGTFEKRFPVRHQLALPSATTQHYSLAPSSDSSALYLGTATGIYKIGSGDSRVLGSSQYYTAGRVYAKTTTTRGGGFVFTAARRLFTASRELGSATIAVVERDPDALLPSSSSSDLFLPYKDVERVERECVVVLAADEGDGKGGRTLSWASPRSAWCTSSSPYYEVLVRDKDTAGGTLCVGWHSPQFAAAADSLRVGGGGDAGCWGVDVLTREVFVGGVKQQQQQGEWKLGVVAPGDVIGCAMKQSDGGDALVLSYSLNGVWWHDAVRVPCGGGTSGVKARPLVSYSCGEATAPVCNFGNSTVAAGFKFPVPPQYVPLCAAMVASTEEDTWSPAPLPLMTCNGRTLFVAYPHLLQPGSVTVDVFALTDDHHHHRGSSSPQQLFVWQETHTFAGGGHALKSQRAELVIASGGGDLILLCSSNNTRGEMAQYALREGKIVPLPGGPSSEERMDAAVFDSQLNLVWGWSAQQNSVFGFENKSLGGSAPAVKESSAQDEGDDAACGATTAAALARLALPFSSVQVPLNTQHTYCAVCNHAELQQTGFRDLFIDPFSPSTFASFAKILEHAAAAASSSSSSLLESVLILLHVNLHVACCRCNSSTASGPTANGMDWAESLRRTLMGVAAGGGANDDGRLAGLAARCLVDAIPLFWPTVHDKVGFIAALTTNSTGSSSSSSVMVDQVAGRVLAALSAQLLLLDSSTSSSYTAVHRHVLDDDMVARLLRMQSGPLAHAASSLLLGLVASAFNHVADVAAAAAPATTPHTAAAAAGEEETKEDSAAVLSVDPFEDLVSLLQQISQHCLLSAFNTPVSSRVLPLVLVALDNVLRGGNAPPESCRVQCVKAMLHSDLCSTLATLAKGVATKAAGAGASPVSSFTFTKLEVMSSVLDSRRFAADDGGGAEGGEAVAAPHLLRLSVNVPFAWHMQITFQSSASSSSSSSRQPPLLDLKPGDTITFKPSKSAARTFSASNLPGVNGQPALLLHHDEAFECSHTDKDSRFAFRVVAHRLVQCKAQDRDWAVHLLDATKRTLSSLVEATTGSTAFGLTAKEQALIRWIQNPLFSGGLKPDTVSSAAAAAPVVPGTPMAPTPRSLLMKKFGSRSSLTAQALQEDADRIVADLLKYTPSASPASVSLAQCLVLGMRQPSNRVPFDAGKLTQPAVCAVVAALIHTNGLEFEAVTFARAVMEAGSAAVAHAPLRLRAVWSTAQLIRAWCDSLVVNGRTEHHFEACGVRAPPPTSSSSRRQQRQQLPRKADTDEEKDKDDEEEEDDAEEEEEEDDDDEREEREYARLCQLVQARCELLAQAIAQPSFLLNMPQRARPKEHAKARWHYVREYLCPKTSRLLATDALTCVLRGMWAWSKISSASPSTTSGVPPAPHRKSSLLSTTTTPSATDEMLMRSPPGSIEIRTSRKASLSSFTATMDVTAGVGAGGTTPTLAGGGGGGGLMMMTSPPPRSASLSRHGSLTSWGGTAGGPRIQSWLVAKDTSVPSPLMPRLSSASLLAPGGGAGGGGGPGTPLSRKASIILDSGARTTGRVEGGLRRAPQAEEGVDLAQMEHEQTMSESVLNFVQSATVLRKRDITAALRSRDERAHARAQGLLMAVTIAQNTDFRSRTARGLFESVLQVTTSALTTVDGTMEAHFLTDLGGCSVAWRERVSYIFLVLLRIVCQHAARVAKNQTFLPQQSALDHLKRLLGSMQLDYVESDYSLLYRAQMSEALHSALRLPQLASTGGAAFQLFERLFRRCVIDHHADSSSSSTTVGGGGSGGADLSPPAITIAGAAGATTGAVVGTIWQQQLMDVLVGGIGSFWSAHHYDVEELEFSDSEGEEQETRSKGQVTFSRKEVYLCHRGARFLSRGVLLAAASSTSAASTVSSTGFSLQCTIRRQGVQVVPGTLLTVYGAGDSSAMQLGVDSQHRLVLRVELATGKDGERVLQQYAWRSSGRVCRWTKLCLLLEEKEVEEQTGRQHTVRLLCTSEEAASHDWAVLPAISTPQQVSLESLYLGSDRAGSRSCQGVVLCDLVLQPNIKCGDVDAFFGNDATALPKEVEMTSLAPPAAATRDEVAGEDDDDDNATILSCLDLANLALKRSHSSIALARLSTPDAQNMLLQLVLDSRCPVQVRVSASRVLKRVLSQQPRPSAAQFEQLCSCISSAMPPAATRRSSGAVAAALIPDPSTSATMAQVVVDLVFFLCDANAEWSSLVATWVAAKLGALRKHLEQTSTQLHLPDEDGELRQCFAAIALCGGRMDFLRLGGKAVVVGGGGGGGEQHSVDELVHIVAQCGEKWGVASCTAAATTPAEPASDITSQCTVSTADDDFPLGSYTIRLPNDDEDAGGGGGYVVSRVEIHHSQQHSAMRHARVTYYGEEQQLLLGGREIQVDPTVPMFALDFAAAATTAAVRLVRIDVMTVWGGQSAKCAVKELRVFATRSSSVSSSSTATSSLFGPVAAAALPRDLLCRPVASIAEADEAEGDKDAAPPTRYAAAQLLPHSRQVPKAIVEQLLVHHKALASFEKLLFALHAHIAARDCPERLLALDLFTRLLKTVCTVVPMLAHVDSSVGFVSRDMALFLCSLAKTQNAQLAAVPTSARFKRGSFAYPERWNVKFTAKPGEDMVRFEPPLSSSSSSSSSSQAATWPHRVAVVDSSAAFGNGGGGVGRLSWTFTLVQDGASRGDESVLFGLCSSTSTAAFASSSSLDLLQPHAGFRLLRAFDGSAVGESPPSPMLCVRVGDALRCEWDVARGTLSMGVNDRPLVVVFSGPALQRGGGGDWFPCVATYAERGAEVVVSLSHMRCTPQHPKRRLLGECLNMGMVQVEAAAQAALQAMMHRSEDAVSTPTRSLTFQLSGEEEEEEEEVRASGGGGDTEEQKSSRSFRSALSGGSVVEEEEDGVVSDGDDDDDYVCSGRDNTVAAREAYSLRRALSSSSSSSTANNAAAAALSWTHNPALCGVIDSAHAVQQQQQQPRPATSAAATASSSSASRPSGTVMNSAERYLALLWELTARLSTEGFDTVVKYWPSSTVTTATTSSTASAPTPPRRWADVEETVAAMFRVHVASSAATMATGGVGSGGQLVSTSIAAAGHSSASTDLELLHVIDVDSLVAFAGKRIVGLGSAVRDVKQRLRRPTAVE